MELCTPKVLIKAGLCLGFLFKLLLCQAKMVLRARLDAMQRHSTHQPLKRQRSPLASLSFDSTVARPLDGCHSLLDDYSKQKESLIRIVHRRSVPSKVFKKPRFLLEGASIFRSTNGGSHPHVLPSSRDNEGDISQNSLLNDDSISERLMPVRKQQASPSLDVPPSSKPIISAEALVDFHAPTYEQQHVDVAVGNSRSIACEPSDSQDDHVHRDTTLLARDRSGGVCSIFKGTVSGACTQGELLKQDPPVYKQLLKGTLTSDTTIKGLNSQIELQKAVWEKLQRTKQALFALKRRDTLPKPTSAAFTPLSEEEEEEVRQALKGANRQEILVQHGPSSIGLSRETLQCLKPGAWLNDEVINLYMELLKERECREQKDYLKCHFFNTFFYNKLYKDAKFYNYKAVRRWTMLKKLGYSLLQCDKIFVPIHKDIHWCLAVINLREKKLQYLDSLKGEDMDALRALAGYLRDEAKDKDGENLDTSTWELECLKEIPQQLNGCDCGMFMIKYADFLSRGEELKFTQENMEYFRKRTVLELLQLKAR